MSDPSTAPIDAAAPSHASAALRAHPGDVLYDFVHRLLMRARTTLAPADADDGVHDGAARGERIASLHLAEAALRLHLARDPATRRPLQIAVFGPTQVGKSTVVNLLVGSEAATVSPLAGFTIHAQAFAVAPRRMDATEALPARLFPNWPRVPRAALLRDQLEAYAFEFVPPSSDAPPPDPTLSSADRVSTPAPGVANVSSAARVSPRVVWDTPDFDSLAARFYQRTVLEIAAAAELLVLVVSKEKYADLSVWRTLRLLAPLGTPLIVVLNKLAPQADALVRDALAARLDEFGGPWAQAPVAMLPYCATLGRGDVGAERAAWVRTSRDELERAVAAGVRLADEPSSASHAAPRGAGVVALLEAHWASWAAPLEAEHAAAREFDNRVSQAAEQILAEYRRDYLDHPQRYDAFRRAGAELLELLELPGLAGTLTQVRHVVTWPARRLVRAGRTLWERSRARPGAPGTDAALAPSSGALVLLTAADAQLVALERALLLRCDDRGTSSAWWRAIRQRFATHRDEVRAAVRAACEALERALQTEIQAAARELYELLCQRPALPYNLRDARDYPRHETDEHP
ncbi:MAG: GTPase, partial [Phycisphaerae bacterium]